MRQWMRWVPVVLLVGPACSLGSTFDQDGTAPTVLITSPSQGQVVRGSVTVAAAAEDNVGVAFVRFQVDGRQIAVDSVAPYTATWNSDAETEGQHTLRAVAVDLIGNTGNHAVTVTVNRQQQ